MNIISHVKNISKDTAVYGIANACAALIGILTAPILTRIFHPADYGVTALIQTTVSFLVMVAGFNLTSGVFRYFYEYDSLNKKVEVLSTSLYCNLLISIILCVTLYVTSPYVKDLLINIRKINNYETMV